MQRRQAWLYKRELFGDPEQLWLLRWPLRMCQSGMAPGLSLEHGGTESEPIRTIVIAPALKEPG